MTPPDRLRALLAEPGLVVMPAVWDGLTAKLAAGAGFLYPVTVERVANWANGLQGRGFVLVPASAIVGASK